MQLPEGNGSPFPGIRNIHIIAVCHNGGIGKFGSFHVGVTGHMVQDLRIAPAPPIVLRYGKGNRGTGGPVAGDRIVHQYQPAVSKPCHVDPAVIIRQGRLPGPAPAESAVFGIAPIDCAFTASHQHMYGSPFILPECGLNHTASGQHLPVKGHIAASLPGFPPILRAVCKTFPPVFLRGSRSQDRAVL